MSVHATPATVRRLPATADAPAWPVLPLAAACVDRASLDGELREQPAVDRQRHAGETDWGAIMAGSVLTALPVVLVFALLQRHFVSKVTGSVR